MQFRSSGRPASASSLRLRTYVGRSWTVAKRPPRMLCRRSGTNRRRHLGRSAGWPAPQPPPKNDGRRQEHVGGRRGLKSMRRSQAAAPREGSGRGSSRTCTRPTQARCHRGGRGLSLCHPECVLDQPQKAKPLLSVQSSNHRSMICGSSNVSRWWRVCCAIAHELLRLLCFRNKALGPPSGFSELRTCVRASNNWKRTFVLCTCLSLRAHVHYTTMLFTHLCKLSVSRPKFCTKVPCRHHWNPDRWHRFVNSVRAANHCKNNWSVWFPSSSTRCWTSDCAQLWYCRGLPSASIHAPDGPQARRCREEPADATTFGRASQQLPRPAVLKCSGWARQPACSKSCVVTISVPGQQALHIKRSSLLNGSKRA